MKKSLIIKDVILKNDYLFWNDIILDFEEETLLGRDIIAFDWSLGI